MKFRVCLDTLLSKEAGLLDKIKDVALTEVAGTKPWLIGRKAPVSDSLRAAGKAATRPAATSGVRRAVGGQRVYDVSALADQMGIK